MNPATFARTFPSEPKISVLRSTALAVPLLAMAAMANTGCACSCKQAPAPTSGLAAAPPSSTASVALAAGEFGREMKTCPSGLIDDVEDNDTKVLASGERGGYWFSYADKAGSTVAPNPFVMTQGGAGDSKYAAHIAGTLGTASTIYAGMGFNFRDQSSPYNATFAKGISFRARVGKGASPKVRLAVSDVNTSPDGKVCKDKCYNDFGVDLTLTEQWTKFTVPFSAMTQQPYWGEPRPPSIDASKIFGAQWKISGTGTVFDVWVDDVQFVCD